MERRLSAVLRAAQPFVGPRNETPARLWLSTFLLIFGISTLGVMKLLVFPGFLVLAFLSLRGVRWAYVTFVVLGLLYFPVSVGFRLNPHPCELIPDLALALFSLTNYAHIVLFVLFFLMTIAQFRKYTWSTFAWAAFAGIVMGALVELAEGVSGSGHCRLRDLIPDTAGILLGSVIVLLWHKFRRGPQPG